MGQCENVHYTPVFNTPIMGVNNKNCKRNELQYRFILEVVRQVNFRPNVSYVRESKAESAMLITESRNIDAEYPKPS